jgi:zinc transport system permease protein
MLELLSYPFVQRAFIAGIILAAILSLLGIFVVLRKMAFFADGIAHASLAGIAIGILFSWNPLITALIFSVLFSVALYWLEHKQKLASDTAIGILFTSGMALGAVLISLKPGYQPELISFLFGNILAINPSELVVIGLVGILSITFCLYFLKSLTLLSLDQDTAYVAGVRTNFLQLALNINLALAVVLGIKILGIILVSALLIIPIATSKLIAKSFSSLIIFSLILSQISVIAGIAISFYADIPTGPAIVLTATAIFVIAMIFKNLFKK